MDVKWLERLIVLLVSLFLLAMAIGLFAFAVGWEGGALFAWLVSLREAPLDGVAVGVVLLLAALYLLTTLAGEHRERTIVQETELGQVEIPKSRIQSSKGRPGTSMVCEISLLKSRLSRRIEHSGDCSGSSRA